MVEETVAAEVTAAAGTVVNKYGVSLVSIFKRVKNRVAAMLPGFLFYALRVNCMHPFFAATYRAGTRGRLQVLGIGTKGAGIYA